MPKSHALKKNHPFKWPIKNYISHDKVMRIETSMSAHAQAQIKREHEAMNRIRQEFRKKAGLE